MCPPLRGFLLLLACGLFLAFGDTEEDPPRLADGRPHRVEGWESIGCAECHRAIAEEWAESLHGIAWVDPHYQEAIARKRRPEGCHGCHIPERLHLGDLSKRPRPRDGAGEGSEPLHHGITCTTCHGGPDGEILGPWGAETDAHASVRSPSFTGEGRDRLCAACHQTNIGPVVGVARDFLETDQAAKGLSCVGCHMPIVERPAAIGPDGERSEEREVRSHRILGPWDTEFLASAFALSVEVGEDRTRLVIVNQAAHRVPGLTDRSFVVRARLVDEAGKVVDEEELEITTRSHLPVDGVLVSTLAGRGAAVEVELLHRSPGVRDPIVVLEKRMAADGDGGSGPPR